jgi:hypothetical protein
MKILTSQIKSWYKIIRRVPPDPSSAVEREKKPGEETAVSDHEPERIQPQQNPQLPQTTELVVDDSGSLPTYTNFCRVTATPEEAILDFGLNAQPFAPGRQDVKANQRIVMNFYTAKRLLTALDMTIQRHEQTFGAIELDIGRRASGFRAPMVPPTAPRRADEPEAIKLAP